MAQVLIIDSNKEFSNIVKLNLKKSFDFSVIEKNSIQEAIEFVDLVGNIDLIILNETEENNLLELRIYVKNSGCTSRLLVLGNHEEFLKNETILPKNATWNAVIEVSGVVLGQDRISAISNKEVTYKAVPISYFLNISETSMGCDVYIRVKKADNQFQYIKRLNSTDLFTRADIERYRDSGLKDFYVTSEHFVNFANYATDRLVEKLSNTNLTAIEKNELSSEAYSVAIERISSIGVDAVTMNIVEENIKMMKRVVGDKNAMTDYLKSLMNNKLSFAYSHAYLTCLLMNSVLKKFEWDSVLVREKITHICYFHDISLKDDHLIKISSKEELALVELSTKEKDLVLNHALKSAEIVDKFDNIPHGVSALIREHHGVKSGVGFRDEVKMNISPVMMVFIVVEDFVSHFLQIEGIPTQAQLIDICHKLEPLYNKVAYVQTLEALKSTILNKK